MDNGNYTISDPNVRNGEKVEYGAQGLKDVLTGKEGVDVNGNKVGVSYQAEGEDGRIRVLSDSEGLKEQAQDGKVQEISKEEMEDITGAKVVYETKTETVMVDATRQEQRTRQVQYTYHVTVSYSYTGSDGQTHTGYRTEARTGTRTEKYTVTVHYKVAKTVTKRVAKVVPDPKPPKEANPIKNIVNNVKHAVNKVKDHVEAAVNNIKEKNRVNKEIKDYSKQLNQMKKPDFDKEIERSQKATGRKVEVESMEIKDASGKKTKINLKDSKEKDVEKIIKDYEKIANAHANTKDSEMSYDNEKGWQITVGANTLGKDKAITVGADDIQDPDKFAREANTAMAVANPETGISGATASYNAQDGWQVKVPGVNDPISAADIGEGEGAVKKFVDEYNTATAVTNPETGISGATASYSAQDGWQVTVPGVGGQEAQTISAADIGTGNQAIKNFVDGYNTAAAVANPETGISGATASYSAKDGWQITVPGVDEPISTADIGTGNQAIKNFVDGYNTAAAVTNPETGISGATASYSAKDGWQITVPGADEAISTKDIKNTEEFVSQYKAAKESVEGLGEDANVKFNFDNNKGWQVSVDNKTFNATDIQELGITFGKNDQGQATVSIAGYDQPIQVDKISNTDTFISDFKKTQDISKETGLEFNYDNEKGWQLEYQKGDENKTINVADIKNKDEFIEQYTNAKTIADGIDGTTYEYDAEKGWQITVPEIDKPISAADVQNGDDFVTQYKAMKTAVEGLGEDADVAFSFDPAKGLQVTVEGKTFSGADVAELGITFGTNEDNKPTVQLPGVDQPINMSDIKDTDKFINNYKDGLEMAQQPGLDLSYDTENQEWMVSYNDGKKDQQIKVSEIENKDDFIEQYKKANTVKTGIDGANYSYDPEKGWSVTVPNAGGAISANDIDDADNFVTGYNMAKAMYGYANADENNKAAYTYNKEDGSWDIKVKDINENTVTFNMKGNDITVKSIVDKDGYAKRGQYLAEVNKAFASATGSIGNMFSDDPLKKVQQISISAAQNLLSSGGKVVSSTFKDFAYGLMGIDKEKGGVVINEKDGTMTQYGADGSATVVDLNYKDRSSQFDYDTLRDIANSEGFDRALDYAKCYGAVQTIKGYDKDGIEQYTATNVGYNENDHCMALEYDFTKDYKGGESVYFQNAEPGSSKLVIENFYPQDPKDSSIRASKESAMVYDIEPPKGSPGMTLQKVADYTINGMNIRCGAIKSLDAVVEWSVERKGDDIIQTAKGIDFKNGDKVPNGEKGDASGFVTTTVNGNGDILTIDRTDLAYHDSKQTGGSGQGSDEGIADEYKKILEHTNRLKANGDFYSGYEKIDNAWIDTSKITSRTYDVQNKQFIQRGAKTGDGDPITVVADVSKGGLRDDWMYNIDGAVAPETNITVYGEGPDGERYSVEGKTGKGGEGYNWADITQATFNDTAYVVSEKYGTPITATTKFSVTEGFTHVSFDAEDINKDANEVAAAAAAGEDYTPKYFYNGEEGYVGGVRIADDGTVLGAEGANVQIKDEKGDTYYGTIDSDTALSDVLEGKGATFTQAETNKYGTPILLTAGEGESIEFGKADFSEKTINADADALKDATENGQDYTPKYSYRDSKGNSIGGVRVEKGNNDQWVVKGAQGAKVTLVDGDGSVYFGTMTEDTEISAALKGEGSLLTEGYTDKYGKRITAKDENGLKFGEAFTVESINAAAKEMEDAIAKGETDYTPKYFYQDGKGNYVGGVKIEGDGSTDNPYVIKAIKGADVQINNADGIFLGYVTEDTDLDSVLNDKTNVKTTVTSKEETNADGSKTFTLSGTYKGKDVYIKYTDVVEDGVLKRTFAAGSTISASSAAAPAQFLVSNADFIELSKAATFEFIINEDNSLTAREGDKVFVEGTYNHVNPDGSISTSKVWTKGEDGLTEGAYFEVGKNGDYGLNAELTTDGQKWTTAKGGGGQQGGEEGDSETVNTKGLITETDDSFSITDNKDGSKGIISVRNGNLTIVGNGTVATSGSVLGSGAGYVITDGGDYIYSNGTWAAGSSASTFSFVSPNKAKQTLTDNFSNVGLEVSGLEKFDFTGKMSGDISSDAMTMFGTILNNQSDEVADKGANFVDKTNTGVQIADGITLSPGASFNISLQTLNGEKVMAFKANDTLNATYKLPNSWKAEGTTKTEFTEEFTAGQYITAAAILNKAGVQSLVGKDIEWRGKNYEEITVSVSHMDNHNRSAGYNNLAYCYFTLPTTEEPIHDSANGVDREVTALSSEYNGTTYHILAGARVSIGDGSLAVTNARVYAEGMNVTDQEKQDKPEGNGGGGAGDQDLRSTFEGEIYRDADGKLIASGVFNNYSDATASQVFSESTVYNVGSILSAKDGKIEGLGNDVSGKVRVVAGEEEGTIDFKAVGETVTYTTDSGKKFSLDTKGNKHHEFQESDVLLDKDQHLAYYDGKPVIVDDGKLMELDRGVSFIGTCCTKDGSWNRTGNDVKIIVDGKEYYIDPKDIREIVELTDSDEQGIGVYVGMKSGDMKNEGQTVGISSNDDMTVLLPNGTKKVIDIDGTWFKAGLPDISVGDMVSGGSKESGSYIESPNLKNLTLRDLAGKGGASSEDARQVMLNGSAVYVNTSAFGDNWTEGYKDPDTGMNVVVEHGTKQVPRSYTYGNQTYNTYDTVKTVKVTYTDNQGKEYTYDGTANGDNKYKLSGDNNTYVNFDLTGNSYTAETVEQGPKRDQKVTRSYVDFTGNADGSGSSSVYTDFLREGPNGQLEPENIDSILNGSTTHKATQVDTTWDRFGRQTYVNNATYTWEGSWKKDIGRAKDVTVEEGSYRETYAYRSDADTYEDRVVTSRVDYRGHMSDINYDKNKIKDFTLKGDDYLEEITTEYRNGEPVSEKKVVLSGYTGEDLSAYGIDSTGVAKISYQYDDDGVQYLQSASNVKRETYVGTVTEVSEGRATGVDWKSTPSKVDYIVNFKQNTISTTTSSEESSESYKTITTTTTEQDIVTVYNCGQDEEFAVESKLLSPETRSTLYDGQHRVVYETQDGGVYEVKALTSLDSDKVLTDTEYTLGDGTTKVDLSAFVGSGIKEGDILSVGKQDSIKTYKYNDDGTVETDSITYNYNYLDQSALYDTERYGSEAAKNGTVEIVLEHSEGDVVMKTSKESFTYALNAGTAGETGTAKDYDSRTINYDKELGHTYSYSVSVALGGYGFLEGGSREEMLFKIKALGDDDLFERASGMTDEQLEAMFTSDTYTFYGLNVDFHSNQVTIDINMATTEEYDALGRLTERKVTGLYGDGGDNGGHFVFELANAGFLSSTDVSGLKLNFTASGIFSSKSVLNDAGEALFDQSEKIAALVEQDRKTGTNNVLGSLQDFYVEKVDSNFVYDALGRAVANETTRATYDNDGNIVYEHGLDVTKYTSTGPNGVTVAETYSFNVQNGQVGYLNSDGDFVAFGTNEKGFELSLTDANGDKFKPISTNGYGYAGVGYNSVLKLDSAVVDQYNKTADARDAQRLSRDQVRNETITAVVTALYIAATIALAVCTFGTSLIASLTVIAAIAAIPSVMKSMDAGMKALTVGDTATAIKEFIFVAMDFAVVIGGLTKAFSAAAKVADAVKGLDEAAKAAKLAELAKISKQMATAVEVYKRIASLGKVGELIFRGTNFVNGISAAFKASKAGQFLSRAKTVISPMSTLSQKASALGFDKAAEMLKYGVEITGNWSRLATVGLKTLNSLGAIGLNAVMLGVDFGPVHWDGLLPKLARSIGLGNIVDDELFKTISTIAVFSPIFNKEIWMSQNASDVYFAMKQQMGSSFNFAALDSYVTSISKDLAKLSKDQVGELLEKMGQSGGSLEGMTDVLSAGLKEKLAQNAPAIWDKSKTVWENVKDIWKDSSRWDSSKSFLQNIKENNIFKDWAKSFSELGSQLGLGSNWQNVVANAVESSITNSFRMIKDISVFNVVVIDGIFGTVNTALDSVGLSFNGEIPLPIPNLFGMLGAGLKILKGEEVSDDFSFFLKVQAPVYSTGGDFIGAALDSVAETVSSPNMWAFSAMTPVLSAAVGPVFQNIPGVGRVARFASSFDEVFQNVGNEQVGSMLGTFYSENIREEFMGAFVDMILPGISPQFREMLKECFDGTPDGNIMVDYNNGTYKQIGANTAQNLANMQDQTQRAQEIARIQNTINNRANARDNGTRRTNLTAQDILNLNSNSSVYGLLLHSTNASSIRNEFGVRIAAANNNLSVREISQLRQLVNSNNANIARSSYLNDMINNGDSVGLMATYLQDASGVVLSNRGHSDSIRTDTEDGLKPTQMTSYVRGLAQVQQNMPVNEQLTRNLNTAFDRLDGSYEMINALGTALDLGVDYNAVQPYIMGMQFSNSEDFDRNAFNYNLQTVAGAIAKNEGQDSRELQDFAAKVRSDGIISTVIQNANIKGLDVSKYTVQQAEDMISSEDASMEQLYFAAQILNAHNDASLNKDILGKINSLDLSNLSASQKTTLANTIQTLSQMEEVDISSYDNINSVLGEEGGHGRSAENASESAPMQEVAKVFAGLTDSQQTQFTVDEAGMATIKAAVSDYIDGYAAAKEAGKPYKRSASVSAVEDAYFLTDAQLAKMANMSDSEMQTYLRYNLAAKQVAGVLNDNMRQAVRQYMIDSSSDKEKAEQDYDTLLGMVTGEIKGKTSITPILEYLQDSFDEKDYDNFVRVMNGEKVEKDGEVLTEKDVISGLINGMSKKYGLNTAVPYSVLALSGFRDGQKEAFRDILQATVENGGEVEEKSAGYAQELQTAGGKSIIGLFSVLLLSANPNIEGRDNKFITWLTNENSNAEELYNHIDFVFGSSLGKVELITNTEDKEGLREKLDNAGIIIGTYSSWGSLFSEAMAGLLSYGPEETRQEVIDQVEHNKALLKGANIELEETTLSDNKTVKVQFKNAKDSAEAIKLLLAEGQGLDRINLPIGRISQLVGDELDYAATIPASALASAAGKYTKQYGMVDYYDKLLSGATIEAQDYAYLGVNEEKLNADRELLNSNKGRKQLEQTRDAYKSISDAIDTAYKGTSDKKNRDAIVTEVLGNETVKSAMKLLEMDEQQVRDIVNEQYSSIRNLEVRSRLLGLEGYDKLDVKVDDQQIDIAEMSRFTEGDKGTRKIADGQDAVIRTVAAEEAQDGYKDNMITNIRETIEDVRARHEGEDVDAQKGQEEKPVITQEQYDKALEELISTIYAEYSDVFRTETEVREFLVTGMDALSLFTAKKNVGTGSYLVEKDGNDKAQNVYITNNGTPMKSLNMPGMWTIELLEGCDNINKPSLETFISSKEALAAFEWSVGFSGTFSSSIRTLLKDLDYGKIGGSMPDTMKVGVTTALTQEQGEITEVIAQARKKLNAQGIAGVDLIMTANSDVTTQIVEGLTSESLGESRVSPDDIVSLSLDLLDSELTKLSNGEQYPSARVAEVMSANGVEDYSVSDLANIDMNVKIKVLQEVLKNVMKNGEVSFIVGDVSLLGRGWNPGDMGGAVESLKAKQNLTASEAKVQATMWKVNFEKMDATQSEQGDGRFAHRDGKSRFSSEFFNRDIVQITSVDSVRENKILREAAAQEGGYSVGLILNNLNDVMEANEEATLQKANNAVVNETKQWAKAQDTKGNVAPTYAQARARLSEELGEEAAKGIMDKVLEIGRVRVGNEEENMTREVWFAYENYERYVAASKAMGVEANSDAGNEKVQKVMKGDVVAALELIKESNPKANVDDLINAVRNINDNYSIQQGKVAAMQEGLSAKDKAIIAGLNKKDIGILGKLSGSLKAFFSSDIRALMKESKKLEGYGTEFAKANDALKGKIKGDLGIVFDRRLGKVSFAVQDGIKKAIKAEEVFDKVKGMSAEEKKIMTAIVQALTNPKVQSVEVQAIGGLMGKTDANEISIKEIGELFGIADVKGMSNNEIMNKVMGRMMDIRKEGGNTAATELSVELTAIAGGLLFAMKSQEVNTVGELDQKKINGNQKTISEILKVEYKTNYAKEGAEDFVINIAQLRKTISEEGKTYTAEQRNNILDILAMGNLNWQAEENKIAGLFNMRNVHAIAASA